MIEFGRPQRNWIKVLKRLILLKFLLKQYVHYMRSWENYLNSGLPKVPQCRKSCDHFFFIFSLVWDTIGKDLMRGKQFYWCILNSTANVVKHYFSKHLFSVCFLKRSKNQANWLLITWNLIFEKMSINGKQYQLLTVKNELHCFLSWKDVLIMWKLLLSEQQNTLIICTNK